MFESVEIDTTASPYCVRGLQLCKCLARNPSPQQNEDRPRHDQINQVCTKRHSRSGFGPAGTPVNESRRLLQQMKRHDRPSLSKQWINSKLGQDSRLTEDVCTSKMERGQTPLDRKRSLRPIMKDHHHQDSLFGNSFQSKSFFVVHPEWLSETVDNTDPQPLHRPPWPWEQPRYRQNIQRPITYTAVESEANNNKINEDKDRYLNGELPGMPIDVPLNLPIGYTFTQPGIDITKPFEKQTQFGAPIVDTSVYRLSY